MPNKGKMYAQPVYLWYTEPDIFQKYKEWKDD